MQWDLWWTGKGWGWGGLSLFKVTSRRSTINSGTANTIAGGSVKVRTVYLQHASYTIATLIYLVFRKEIIGLKYNIRLRLWENTVNGMQCSISLVSRHMLGQDLPGSAARVLHCWLCAVCMRVALGDVIWHPYHRAGCTRSAIAIKTVRAPRGGERSWFLITTLFPHISHSSRLSANRLRAAERNKIWSRQNSCYWHQSYLLCVVLWYPNRPFFLQSALRPRYCTDSDEIVVDDSGWAGVLHWKLLADQFRYMPL